MSKKESAEAAEARWAKLEALQLEYENFNDFLDDVFDHLGFDLSWVQADIGDYLANGPQHLMIQAQRGQAKTTITAAFAVWSLIHNPKARILIVSAGGTQANEISTLVVKLIDTMSALEFMRPDRTAGDRTSVEKYDIHYTLKGLDKSPSVACAGITANMQGKRADILIADDIESSKNAMTALMRQVLMDKTRDFTSICIDGRIIYLGTPQSVDSVYNTLPGRGFKVRIWPGRYPTMEQIDNYNGMLAPRIMDRLSRNPLLGNGGGVLGDQGQPVEEGKYLGEAQLQFKELDQGPSYFQLQHMLNTRLVDANRFPLKPEHLVVMNLGKTEQFPLTVIRGFGADARRDFKVGNTSFQMTDPHEVSKETAKLQGLVMYVDPAGGGKVSKDETAYCIAGFLNSNIYVLEIGGMEGGYETPTLLRLKERARYWNVQTIKIEKNMGYGAFSAVWTPILRGNNIDPNTGQEVPDTGFKGGIEEDLVRGQKELRIIGTLEPVMARGALIFDQSIVTKDEQDIQAYIASEKQTYSLFHQMSRLTREPKSLPHDDRLDALEGAVRHFVHLLAIDQKRTIEAARLKEIAEFQKDPLGHKRRAKLQQMAYGKPGMAGSVLSKYRVR